MNACSDSLGEEQMFSTLDANSGYWQIKMDNKDVRKTVYLTYHSFLKFYWMPFELKNAQENVPARNGRYFKIG